MTKPAGCLLLMLMLMLGGCAAMEATAKGGARGEGGADYLYAGTRSMIEPRHDRFFAHIGGGSLENIIENPLLIPIFLPIAMIEIPGTVALDTALLPSALSYAAVLGALRQREDP